MGNELLASKVIVVEEQPRIRNIQGVPTSITALLGVTERGPVGVPVLSTSFEEWSKVFGGFIANSDAALSAQGFFDNGGTQLWTVRIVHYTDVSNPSTKTSDKGTLNLLTAATAPSSGTELGANASPFLMHSGDTIVADIDAGSDQTATFNATAASRTSGNTSPFALANNDTLLVAIDGGSPQTVTFLTGEFVSIGAATAAEVAAVLNGSLVGASATVSTGAVVITSDRKGTGSGVQITGGTANSSGKLNFPTGLASGTGNVSNIGAVTAAEVISVLSGAISGATISQESGRIRITSSSAGPTSSVLVKSSSTAGPEIGFDNAAHFGGSGAAVPTIQVDGRYDGTYAANVTIAITDATSGDADKFNANVLVNGLTVERFANITMDAADDRYVEAVVNDPDNGSDYVTMTDLGVSGTTTQRRPNDGTFGPLTGGADGLTSLADVDFTGNAGGGTGLRALDQTLGIRILTVPGRATSPVHNAMVTYAEITRGKEMFAILDPPLGMTAAQIRNYVVNTASLRGLSEFGAIYWPNIKILNPSTAIFGKDAELVAPPSCHIAGMYSRTDASTPGGVYIPPAGEETGRIVGATGLETDEVLDEGKRDLVFPDLINPITKFPGAPIHCDGARTLKDNGNFPTIGERRGVIFIEQSIKDFLRVFKHKNNNETLRAQVDRSVTAFLVIQMNNEAFQTKDPATAFFVDVGAALNPPTVVFARQLIIRVGLATNKPAEFIILRVSQDTRALEEELAAAKAA